jgi:hypothetical protein
MLPKCTANNAANGKQQFGKWKQMDSEHQRVVWYREKEPPTGRV